MNRQPEEPWEIELDEEIKQAEASPFCICGAKKRKGHLFCPTCDNEAVYLMRDFINNELDVAGAGFAPIKLPVSGEKSNPPIKPINADAPINQTQPMEPDASRLVQKAAIAVLEQVDALAESNGKVIDALMALSDVLKDQRSIITGLDLVNDNLSRIMMDNAHLLTDEQKRAACGSLNTTVPLAKRFRAGNSNMNTWIREYINALHSKGNASASDTPPTIS